MTKSGRISGSFRDPSGHLFVLDETIYRQINLSYREDYDYLIDSGLYSRLTDSRSLIPHETAADDLAQTDSAYKIIVPHPIPFISYPYEWCFSQLKDAALLTLNIQSLAMDHGMVLKDASAYNVQFLGTDPILIDTLSFEKYRDGEPWVAYRQFCQHFLAPLALAARKDMRLSQLLRVYIDGVPLDLASALLPRRTHFNFGILTHIHLHAKAQRRFAAKTAAPRGRMRTTALRGLIDGLRGTVRKLQPRYPNTEWRDYYDDTNYTSSAIRSKADIVTRYLDKIKPKTVWDLGANTGEFSRIAANAASTVAFDIDPVAVEKNYLNCRQSGSDNLLPLLLDLTNPSPGMGWSTTERMSIIDRGPSDLVMALALIHHLCISNNLPFANLAEFLADICRDLIIEFVPKDDSQVQRLLRTREDIFDSYDQSSFEKIFSMQFDIEDVNAIPDSKRTLYLMRNKRLV
ncbi:MAG: SAM-dependent methyltransferase [Candidatus Latescibacterota bacterium]|nr:MAG: SAM-dependent methyltransferase [Candidatus Latescibacterota bacterium]